MALAEKNTQNDDDDKQLQKSVSYDSSHFCLHHFLVSMPMYDVFGGLNELGSFLSMPKKKHEMTRAHKTD